MAGEHEEEEMRRERRRCVRVWLCVCSGAHIGLLEKCRSYAIRLAVLCQAQIDGAAAASALIRTHHAKVDRLVQSVAIFGSCPRAGACAADAVDE